MRQRLLRQRRGAAGNGLGITIKKLRRTVTASAPRSSTCAAPWALAWAPRSNTCDVHQGNGQDITIKYLRCVFHSTTRQRRAARPHQRALPRDLGRQVRAPRGALRPRARRDLGCNPRSPLGKLFRPVNLVSQNAGTGSNWAKAHHKKGWAPIPPNPFAM
jgi:hypothetical protein